MMISKQAHKAELPKLDKVMAQIFVLQIFVGNNGLKHYDIDQNETMQCNL